MTDIFINKRIVGSLEGGIFTQMCQARHIFRQYNAKGMDGDLFTNLKTGGRCHTWRLLFKDTGQVLSIPFEKIALVAFVVNTGSGRQMMVKLSEFTQERPVIQHKLFTL